MAMRLLERGLSVIPVPRPDGHHEGKIPASGFGWRTYQSRLPTDDELRRWFRTQQNIAVITGAISGVVVIDVDSPDALHWARRRLLYTPWQTKTSRGYHLWYAHPGVLVRNRSKIDTQDGRLAIDIRGDGGYVLASGSVHASGFEYRESGDWSVPREQLPRFWPGWMERPRREKTVSPPRIVQLTGGVVDRARRYLAAIPQPEIGSGSDAATLYAACRLVRGFGLSAGDAEELLWAWAGGRDGWTREWIAQKVAHADAYGTEPIGSLR